MALLSKNKSEIYHKDKNDFYVYAKPNLCGPNSIVKYVRRYLGRPVIALSRIDSYDGDNVAFHYSRHEDNSFVKKTLPAIDFNTWRRRFLLTMGYDPLQYPNCKKDYA